MSELFWKLLAKIVSQPAIADWLIDRSRATPYFHLPGYMNRHWVFNGYDPGKRVRRWGDLLPAIRVHEILRADRGRHKHDHPWDARTIILSNGYVETRLVNGKDVKFLRKRGDTATLNYGEYHRIDELLDDLPVWTLFITWRYRGTWGFWVDGKKIPHREYQGEMP